MLSVSEITKKPAFIWFSIVLSLGYSYSSFLYSATFENDCVTDTRNKVTHILASTALHLELLGRTHRPVHRPSITLLKTWPYCTYIRGAKNFFIRTININESCQLISKRNHRGKFEPSGKNALRWLVNIGGVRGDVSQRSRSNSSRTLVRSGVKIIWQAWITVGIFCAYLMLMELLLPPDW